jgi:sirohydrochlorin ferrochelatase
VTVPLVLVAHGSRDDAAHACVEEIVDAVRAALPGVDVRLGYVDVRGPKVADAVAGLDGAVVVPAFLASGYHVRTDLPAQLADCMAAPERFLVTPAIGPDLLLARAARARLAEAGWQYGDAVVLAAAGSSDAAALAEVRAAGRMLAAEVGRRVRVGFVATATPRVDAVVAGLRAAGERRITIASWLLAPGIFHTRLAETGADAVAAPLGAHPDVVATVVARYRTAPTAPPDPRAGPASRHGQ